MNQQRKAAKYATFIQALLAKAIYRIEDKIDSNLQAIPSIISIEEGIGWITVKSLNFKARLPLSKSVHSEVIIGLQSEEIEERLNRTSTQIEFAFQFAF